MSPFATLSAMAGITTFLIAIVGQPYAHELPPRMRGEEVAISRANVRWRGRTRTAAQHHLPAHEFAVVLTERAGIRPVSGIGEVRAARPLPDIAEQLLNGLRSLVQRRWQRMMSAASQKVR